MSTINLPDAAGAFTLSVLQAAQVLKVTPTQLLDLCTARFAYYLTVPPHVLAEQPPLRFAPGLLGDTAEMLERRQGESKAADVVMVSTALREYLAEIPPVDNYEQARTLKMPVLAKNRAGDLYAHVQAEVLMEQVCNRQGFMLGSRVRAALEALGGQQLKSLHSLNDGRQRWHTWWRLPHAFWDLDDDRAFRIDESIARWTGSEL